MVYCRKCSKFIFHVLSGKFIHLHLQSTHGNPNIAVMQTLILTIFTYRMIVTCKRDSVVQKFRRHVFVSNYCYFYHHGQKLYIIHILFRISEHLYLNHRKYVRMVLSRTSVCKYRTRDTVVAIKHLNLSILSCLKKEEK